MIDLIRVRRVGSTVPRRLETAPRRAGTVHSVFDRVVNIACHDGRLLTLQGPGPLVAPFAIELETLPDTHRLTPGAPVTRTTDELEVGHLLMRRETVETVETAMPHVESPAGARAVLAANVDGASAPALSSRLGVEARAQLAAGIARCRSDQFIAGARALLGLGEGLTPAGDDCLVGALAVLHSHAGEWIATHPEIRAALDGDVARVTTAISAEFLRHALAGHFAEIVIDVLTARSDATARHAVVTLLTAGATSGADTLVGMQLAMTALGHCES